MFTPKFCFPAVFLLLFNIFVMFKSGINDISTLSEVDSGQVSGVCIVLRLWLEWPYGSL